MKNGIEKYAYISGFCESVRRHGIDPRTLVKSAGFGAFFRRLFAGRQTAQKAIGSYASAARKGVAPTIEQARGTMDKVLSEYFGGKVPKGLRESIMEPLTWK